MGNWVLMDEGRLLDKVPAPGALENSRRWLRVLFWKRDTSPLVASSVSHKYGGPAGSGVGHYSTEPPECKVAGRRDLVERID